MGERKRDRIYSGVCFLIGKFKGGENLIWNGGEGIEGLRAIMDKLGRVGVDFQSCGFGEFN